MMGLSTISLELAAQYHTPFCTSASSCPGPHPAYRAKN
jgi:hypothetical protein